MATSLCGLELEQKVVHGYVRSNINLQIPTEIIMMIVNFMWYLNDYFIINKESHSNMTRTNINLVFIFLVQNSGTDMILKLSNGLSRLMVYLVEGLALLMIQRNIIIKKLRMVKQSQQ